MTHMIDETDSQELEKQQYRIVGSHSTVKVCGWTKHALKGVGVCYKQKFYGIMAHRCLQMSTSLSCGNRCVFCWRGKKAVVSKDWKWDVDEPSLILEGSLKAQKKLLEGFGGNDKVDKELYQEALEPRHVALSLTGEPINYPRMNEFIDLCNKAHISTFVVTNGSFPEELENLSEVTQVYLSVDSPNKELAKEVGRPLFADGWERFQRSVKAIANKKSRTAIRITAIKNLNMVEPEGYANIIKEADVDFVEVKAYMHVGASQLRLKREQMPFHLEVLDWAKQILQFLPDYELVMEQIPSRVILLVKKDFKINGKWNTWIDFEKWHELINSGKEFSKFDFLKETPSESIGISGKDVYGDKYEEMDN